MATTTQRPTGGQAAAAPKARFAVTTGRRARPFWVHLYGPEGVGKTSFAADAPAPVFIDIEGGTFEKDVARFTFDETTRCRSPCACWRPSITASRRS
jgi:hypothetical protein